MCPRKQARLSGLAFWGAGPAPSCGTLALAADGFLRRLRASRRLLLGGTGCLVDRGHVFPPVEGRHGGDGGGNFTWGDRHLLTWLRRSCTIVVKFEIFNLVPIVRCTFLRLAAHGKTEK